MQLTNYFKCKLLRIVLLSLIMVCGFSHVEIAESKFTSSKKNTAKVNRPSQEEYYSVVKKGLTIEERNQAKTLVIQTINSINEILKVGKVKGMRQFELYLRLGELYSELHDYIRDEETEKYNIKYNNWVSKGAKGKPPVISYSKSNVQLANAANAFRILINKYPKHPRSAAALYALGKTLSRLNDPNAVIYFEKLIKRHSNSNLVPDAYLSLGEYYFERHNIDKAIEAYSKAMKYKNHRAYPYIIYKLGWSYYNATPKNDKEAKQFLDKSITCFKLVIRLSDRDQGKIGRLNLREEAIKDLIMVWAETEDIQAAWVYFEKIGEKKSFYTLLERLGYIYEEQGKNEQAIQLYTRLIKENPTRPNNPRTFERIIKLKDWINNPSSLVVALEQMCNLFFNNSSIWVKANKSDSGLMSDTNKLVEYNLHRYGTLLHQKAQKSKNKKMLAAAANIYKLYLKNFSQTPNAYDIRFYLADINFEFGEYIEAANNYTIVVNAKPNGKHLKTAALNAVLAVNEADSKAKYPPLPPPGQVQSPIILPNIKAQLIKVIDNYITVLPKDSKSYPMRFTAAEIYFNYGHYDQALKRFQEIIALVPNSKQADASIRYILGYYVEKQEWERLISACQDFLKNKKIMHQNLKNHIYRVWQDGVYQYAMMLDKGKNYKKAADMFLEFYKKFPKDTRTPNALYNASIDYYKAGTIDEAIKAHVILITSYPDSKLTADSMVMLAQTYESIGKFNEAANIYHRFAIKYTQDKRASSALYNAATLYKGLNKLDKAEELYQLFCRYYPKHELYYQSLQEVAQIQEKLGKYPETIKSYEALANHPSASIDSVLYSKAKASLLMIEHGNKTQGKAGIESLYKTLIRKNSPGAYEARHLVAEYFFKQSDKNFKNFIKISISNSSSSKLSSDLAKKQKSLEKTAKKYENIIALADPEYTVASYYKLGEMSEHFAQILINISPPAELEKVEAQKFKSELEKSAFMLKEEAYKAFEMAFVRSKEIESFSQWTIKTYAKISELAPDKHPELIEVSADPTYMSNKIITTKGASLLTN